MSAGGIILGQVAQVADWQTKRTLELIANVLDQLASAVAQQRSGGPVTLTPALLAQIKAALEAAGSHPLQLTGLQQSGFTTFAKAANEWLDSFTASTGKFTASQPAASNLSNGTTGSGAIVLANGPTFTANPTFALQVGSGAVVLKTGATSVSLADPFSVTGLQVFANNAAAVAGGLAVGRLYRTNADPDFIAVVH